MQASRQAREGKKEEEGAFLRGKETINTHKVLWGKKGLGSSPKNHSIVAAQSRRRRTPTGSLAHERWE